MEQFLGKRIREMRERRGLTQDQLAEYLKVQPPNISNYERGKSTPPIKKLEQMATILNTSIDYLLGKTDNPQPFDEDMSKAAALLYQWIDEAIEYFIVLFDGDYPFSRKLINEMNDAISEAAEQTRTELNIKIKVNVNEPLDFNKIAKEIIEGTNREFKINLVDKLKRIAKKYHLWEDPMDFGMVGEPPAQYNDEQEFVEDSKLSEIPIEKLNEYKLVYKGYELSDEEAEDIIQLLETALKRWKQ
ncbi:helix-turn-helix domain-containing protein [Halalkalibacterium halodurans]|uniref:helix-turn-helix domain-containing protein n=1 Tax=Halalkalibacterium halodurans TaxID=86665 RepID=UPI0006A9B347|nr:helix-turn-helix transcriptional regulator [Halalkalibacterium halodurans]TPE68008.1 helix-turn-helix transcriptional regulator [Halalkalibacterium halodurans]